MKLTPGGVNPAPTNDNSAIDWGEMKNCGGSYVEILRSAQDDNPLI